MKLMWVVSLFLASSVLECESRISAKKVSQAIDMNLKQGGKDDSFNVFVGNEQSITTYKGGEGQHIHFVEGNNNRAGTNIGENPNRNYNTNTQNKQKITDQQYERRLLRRLKKMGYDPENYNVQIGNGIRQSISNGGRNQDTTNFIYGNNNNLNHLRYL